MQKNLNIEKIIFKVVQMKFIEMHITNQKLSFDIFMIGNVLNIFMEHALNILMIFVIKEKLIILTHIVLLSITTNIAVLLMTAFMLQDHIYMTLCTKQMMMQMFQSNFKVINIKMYSCDNILKFQLKQFYSFLQLS